MKTKIWARCICGCAPDDHRAVVVRPICVDPGNRVLFEGTLGACGECDCDLYALKTRPDTTGETETPDA